MQRAVLHCRAQPVLQQRASVLCIVHCCCRARQSGCATQDTADAAGHHKPDSLGGDNNLHSDKMQNGEVRSLYGNHHGGILTLSIAFVPLLLTLGGGATTTHNTTLVIIPNNDGRRRGGQQ